MAGLVLGVAVLTAGCAGLLGQPEVVEQDCGNVVGAGGCVVTVENPTDEEMNVRVTVEAITPSGDVAATGSETVRVPAASQESVTVTASSVGSEISHYEVDAESA